MKQYEIRAEYDKETIVVYQAYKCEIGESATKYKNSYHHSLLGECLGKGKLN